MYCSEYLLHTKTLGNNKNQKILQYETNISQVIKTFLNERDAKITKPKGKKHGRDEYKYSYKFPT